ncbi:tetratricopeptide repeat protein [Micromonospora endolithica]|uniref:Tetratricopeptide repeat protein n=2 Tax=Micromonospora endolithica TaxID=230091 RepID=A0A3A9YZA7_9ACTN|nr:tetratricopeptide repeat protein [Micromonospora endolithica]TWJ21944.1 tetratricopeptide repeat protein [Micromonospora endolithica]
MTDAPSAVAGPAPRESSGPARTPLFGVPDPADPGDIRLDDDESLAEVLRPFRRLVSARDLYAFDEEASAAQAAAGLPPVFAPVPRARWDAVVVVDDHLTMSVWADQVAAFGALLRRHVAFHDVRVCHLATGTTRTEDVVLRGSRGGPALAAAHGLPVVHRRRIVLVISDGAGPGWSSGAVQPHLRAWAQRQPVALVHLLPQQMWHRGGIAPQRLRLRAPRAGAANARLDWRHDDPLHALAAAGDPPADTVPVPVVELRPRWLAAWVELVAGRHPRWIDLPALLVDAEAGARPGAAEPRSEPSPSRRVREFVSWASPEALRLATRLAAAPLDLAAIHVVHDDLHPDPAPLHLAEVLTSPLVRPGPADARTRFEFVSGVREHLLAIGRRADTVRVWRALADRLGGTRPALAEWSAVLDAPDDRPVGPGTSDTTGLLHIERSVLHALSGRYLARARRLDQLLEPDTPDESGTLSPPGAGHGSVMMSVGEEADAPRSLATEGAGLTSSTPTDSATPAHTPAVWGNVPPRNPNFTGRADLLVQLYQQVQGGPTAVLPHALHGMGGVGKSHLAVEYVYQHQGEYDLIWWIPAERPAQINASLVELARRMNLTAAGPDVGSARAAVHEALRLGRPYRRWLLVFDNAESPEALLPYLPTGGSGNIMITSRNPQWNSVARTLEVDVFTREESIELLRRRGPELTAEQADRLAGKLGDLPLALEQAAAWRAETGMPAEEYLRLFEEKRVELLEQAPPLDYPLPVAAAWNVSLDRLVVSNPAAFRLLQVCAFLAPEPIPRTLFIGAQHADIHAELNPTLRDPMKLGRAIRDINRYALARVIHRTNSIQMHRLIQAVLVDRMTGAERIAVRDSAHRLLASGDRNDPDTPANWPSYADLYPHVMVSGAVDSDAGWVQQLVYNEARFLYWWGDMEASLQLCRQAYETWRASLGEDASMTLQIGHWLGFMLFKLGRPRDAAELNTRILDSWRRVTTEDTEELLRAQGAVAADLRIAGDFFGALELDEDLYRRHVRALGEDDPSTLNAAHNLAVSLRLTGDVRRAYEVDAATHAHRVLLFGEDHAQTLESLLNLIIDRRELGDYLSARAEMQNVVDRLPMVWGEAQTQTLAARRRLASAVRKAGDHETARVLSQEVRDGFAARYGEQHPDTLLAAFGLAVDLRATGDLAAAERLSEDIIERYRRLFDEEHPYTVAAELNAAIVHRLRGDVARARKINERGLAILTRRLGKDHPLTLAGTINLGNDLFHLREYAAAYELDSDTTARARRVFGPDHPTTLISLGNLAQDLVSLGREEEAYRLHAEITPKFERTLGPTHPATIAGTDLTLRGDCDLDPMPL